MSGDDAVPSGFQVRGADGRKANYGTYAEALDSLRALYPELVAYIGGQEHTDCDPAPAEWHHDRVLVWRSEDDSYQDDGSRAVASVSALWTL